MNTYDPNAQQAADVRTGLLERTVSMMESGRLLDAETCLRPLLSAVPLDSEAWGTWGLILVRSGRRHEGVEKLKAAFDAAPEQQVTLDHLAAALRTAGQLEAASSLYTHALTECPASPVILTSLGAVAMQANRPRKAVAWFRRAVKAKPDDPTSLSNLGAALNACELYAKAELFLSRAVALKPNFPEALLNLGAALHGQGKFAAAIDAYTWAQRFGGRPEDVAFNLATAHEHLGDVSGALKYLDRVIEVNPSHAEAHRNKGFLLLMSGDYARGWAEYAWRWRCRDHACQKRPYKHPPWLGVQKGQRLLVWGEQGIGDEILYASLIPELVRSGVDLTLEVDARLVDLIRRSMPSVNVIARTPLPDRRLIDEEFDAQVSIANLGEHLRPDSSRFVVHPCPYLRPEQQKMALFRRRFKSAAAGPVIALSWASLNPRIGGQKSLKLSELRELFELPGLQWIDVQYGDTSAERQALADELGPSLVHLSDVDPFNDLDSLAAVLAACDLVITASNVVAHLAASMGLQTWILVPASSGKLWYWGQGCDRSIWYPSATLFRQTERGSWREPLALIKEQLVRIIGASETSFGSDPHGAAPKAMPSR